jgi:hypothetical protein
MVWKVTNLFFSIFEEKIIIKKKKFKLHYTLEKFIWKKKIIDNKKLQKKK